MLKRQLEDQNVKLRKQLDTLHENIIKGIKAVIDNTCGEATEHIHTFCNEVNIDFPMVEIVVKVPYGTVIGNVQDENYDDIDFETRDL